ncbi:hypothetical protein [Neomoorella glycerini]
MQECGVDKLILSSSAAVYGILQSTSRCRKKPPAPH